MFTEPSLPFAYRPLHVMHLTASPFYGGPERVILDIVRQHVASPYHYSCTVATFGENGGCEPFLAELARTGFEGLRLVHDMPRLLAASREVEGILRRRQIDILCAHGHKARAVGWLACRRRKIPIIGVSHGWTWQNFKTSLYERFDQWMHRRMDAIVAVSEGQAKKIVRTGTPRSRVHVIYNGIDFTRFEKGVESATVENIGNHEEIRGQLEAFFPVPPRVLIGAAGRLSPEKGFDVLIDAFARFAKTEEGSEPQNVGLLLFGDGFLREALQKQINDREIGNRFRLAGFTSELDRFLPHMDIFVQSSRTEGFPCVNLEAMAAGVPVLATDVGGVPEQIESEISGLLVPSDDPEALVGALQRLVASEELRRGLGAAGREKVRREFTCEIQAERYARLFEELVNPEANTLPETTETRP